MEKKIAKWTIKLHGDFTPKVSVGETVRPGMEIGTGLFPVVIETHSLINGVPLVDDGVFVSAHTPLIEYRKVFSKEIVGSLNEGIARIRKDKLEIISEDHEEIVKSTVWGKILAIGEQSYTVEVKQLKLPILVSIGEYVEANVSTIFDKGMVIGPQHIDENLKDKLVILPSALTYEVYKQLIEKEAKGVIAPSIDWQQYVKVFQKPTISVGIIHGFGMFPFWSWYMHLFAKLNTVAVEVNFAESYMYIPVSDILLDTLPQSMLLFKEYWWGKQVKELVNESGEYIALLETGEKTPVEGEELFNIR